MCPHTIHSTFVPPPLFCFAPLGRLGVRIREGGLLYSGGGMRVSLASSVFKGALLLMAAVVGSEQAQLCIRSWSGGGGREETNKSSKLRASLRPPLIPRSPSPCGPLVHILAAALSGGGAGGGGDGKYDIFSIFSSSSSVCVRSRLVSCLEGRFEEHTPRSSTNSHPHVFDNFLLLLPSIVGSKKGD